MTTGKSTWYVDVNGGLARVDVSDRGERWTMPRSLQDSFSALLAFGARHQREVGMVTGAIQTGPNEVVLRVTAARWFAEFNRFPVERALRLDLATGTVVEYPAPFGLGIFYDGWRRYRIDRDPQTRELFWGILNTVTGKSLASHMGTESVFRLPNGDTLALPPDGVPLGVVDGRLYVRPTPDVATPSGTEPDWSYQIFDLDNLTTDGVVHGAPDSNRPTPERMTPAWSMVTNPESWHERRPGSEFSRDMLQEINTTALQIGTDAAVLLSVMNAESGLRMNAYHPAGRYGLLQLTADQLNAAGWPGTPDEFLTAGHGQIPVIRTHLAGLAVPPDADETGLWICLLLPQHERPIFESDDVLNTVIATPGGPRPELWGTHGVADVDGDGQLTVNDLRRYLRSKRRDPRLSELRDRTLELAAIIPDWPTLTEVNEGDDTGIVRPSAGQLGLTVEIIALQQQPGFDHEQVVSIDPAPGTLAPLTSPVRVTVNFLG